MYETHNSIVSFLCWQTNIKNIQNYGIFQCVTRLHASINVPENCWGHDLGGQTGYSPKITCHGVLVNWSGYEKLVTLLRLHASINEPENWSGQVLVWIFDSSLWEWRTEIWKAIKCFPLMGCACHSYIGGLVPQCILSAVSCNRNINAGM